MTDIILDKLISLFPKEGTIGIIGVGNLGTQIRDFARNRGLHTLLCDPPRNLEEATELGETFFALWGNGMGGCELTNTEMETFVPLDSLKAADIITIQVPLTNDGPYPTYGLITRDFLDSCKATKILCFSAHDVIAKNASNDPRLFFYKS